MSHRVKPRFTTGRTTRERKRDIREWRRFIRHVRRMGGLPCWWEDEDFF